MPTLVAVATKSKTILNRSDHLGFVEELSGALVTCVSHVRQFFWSRIGYLVHNCWSCFGGVKTMQISKLANISFLFNYLWEHICVRVG